ncbi:MAG: DUF2332 domain-containing protein [Pseudomonadota bacterium]|nr:DUF2332 domain-containing protein [Pseudomonadota bacterium]
MSEKPMDYWAMFARDAQNAGSPLYARIVDGVGTDEELKAIAAHAKRGQPYANMLLTPVHYLLLRGADHPLKRFYPTVGGTVTAGNEDPFPHFRDFVLQHRDAIVRLIETRVVNTNEIGRSSVLHAGLRMVAAEAGKPLGLIEIGPSAGLNMIWDRYGVKYLRDGKVAVELAPDAGLVIECELRGAGNPPALPAPKVGRRIGLELNPVDLRKAEERDWLRALMWPDQVARLTQLERAMALFDTVRPEIRFGDALALLPDAIRDVPEDQALCVYHSLVAYQFGHEGRQALDDILTVAGLWRPIWRLALEAEAKNGAWNNWLTLSRYRDGTVESRRLAESHPHGTWIEWLG